MKTGIINDGSFIKINNIEIPEIFNRRIKTNIEYLDKAFGGEGWVPGSTFTINGTPGSGKTTLLCQLLQQLSLSGKNVAYISGEESIYQLAYNCRRVGADNVSVSNISNLQKAVQAIKEHKFEFVVLDSMPCFTMTGIYSTNRDREHAAVECILNAAHENECVIGCVLHVTKTGTYKGTTLLPHAVDANFSLKRDEEDSEIRILEATKNRFGCCTETRFKMTSQGFSFEPVEDAQEAQTPVYTERNSAIDLRSYKIVRYIEEHGHIDMNEAIKICETQQNAYLALRNCTTSNFLIKQGRGSESKWFKK